MFFRSRPKKIEIQPVWDITDEFQDYEVIHISLGPDAEICCLGTNKNPERIDGMFVPAVMETKHQDKIVLSKGNSRNTVILNDQTGNYHFIQPLGDDKILVVAARCNRYKDGTHDLNGKVMTYDGALVREFLLGDGIQDVAVTKNGQIWTSYFDEGVFGNYGWDEPVGSSGLLAWDENGERIYTYTGEAGFISDCYAINVPDDNDVWFYFYTEFELVHLTKDSMITYQTNMDGSDGFVVYNNYVLFRGGYGNRDTYTLYERKANHTLKKIREVIFTAGGVGIKATALDCRGEHLLLLDNKKIYQIALSEILGKL